MPGSFRSAFRAAPLSAALLALAVATAPAAAQDGLGVVHSLVGGVLAHDRGVFSSNEEDGVDVNVEIQFAEPRWEVWRRIGSPRPRLGGHVNTGGDTSQAYAGLYWDHYFLDDLFVAAGLGGTVHDGETDRARGEKELGSRVLFHLAAEAGWRLADRHAVSIYVDHISNAGLADENEGLDTVGIRYHVFFDGRD
jgi:hypothetical protein